MNKKISICIDLDGTLTNFDHRKELYLNGEIEKFYSLLHKDRVNNWCKTLVDAMFYKNIYIFIVTARPEKYRRETTDWLLRHNIRYHELLMSPGIEEQDNAQAKKYIYEKQIKDKYQVLFVVDDRQDVVKMWRKLGIVCLQCDEGSY